MQSQFVHMITYFDLLRTPYEFKKKYDEHNGTFVGGILTMFFVAVLIVQFIGSYANVFFLPIVLRPKWKVIVQMLLQISSMTRRQQITQELYLQQLSEYKIIKAKFNFNQKFVYFNQTELSQYFSLVTVQVNKTKDEISIKEINLKNCDESLFQEDQMKPICLGQNFQLLGSQSYNASQYVTVFMKICENSTNSPNCTTEDKRGIFFKKVQTVVLVRSDLIQERIESGEQYNNRYTSYVVQNGLSLFQPEELHVLLQRLQLQVDTKSFSSLVQWQNNPPQVVFKGIQFGGSEQFNMLVDPVVEQLELVQKTPFSITFNLNKKIHVHQLKQQDFFLTILGCISLFGGLFTSFFTFLQFPYKFYQRHMIYQYLMNQNLIFDLGGTVEPVDMNGHIKPRQTSNFLLKNFSYQVNFGYIDYLFSLVLNQLYGFLGLNQKQNKSTKVFEQAQRLLMQQLDLVHIVEKLYEIDKLKLLLLDEQQLLLFNSLARPALQVRGVRRKSDVRSKKASIKKVGTTQRLADLISFKDGFFKSEEVENDVPELLELFYNVMDNTNPNNYLNKQLIELLKMNKQLYRILEVQYRLNKILKKVNMRRISCKELSGRFKYVWQNALLKIKEMREFGYLDQFLMIVDRSLNQNYNSIVLPTEQNEKNTFLLENQKKKRQRFLQKQNQYINPKLLSQESVQFREEQK